MAQRTSAAGSNRERGTDTVLFVDDEPGILEVYEAMYGGEYDVVTAASGDEALQTFGDHIDVAFLDRRMPDMSGDEVLEAIRTDGYQTPIGIISAVEPEANLASEFDVYITKPAEKSQIMAVIDRHT